MCKLRRLQAVGTPLLVCVMSHGSTAVSLYLRSHVCLIHC